MPLPQTANAIAHVNSHDMVVRYSGRFPAHTAMHGEREILVQVAYVAMLDHLVRQLLAALALERHLNCPLSEPSIEAMFGSTTTIDYNISTAIYAQHTVACWKRRRSGPFDKTSDMQSDQDKFRKLQERSSSDYATNTTMSDNSKL
eukprot:2209945-Amphidinium_carterae.1